MAMRILLAYGMLAALVLSHDMAVAAEPTDLLELQIGDNLYTGTVLAQNEELFWFLKRDGRLEELRIERVSDYKVFPGRFRSFSTAEMRDQLLEEFGRGYEVAASSHYLVVAGQGDAKRYLPLFEELYRHVNVYFTARGFTIHEPEFPLVAIVFPDQRKFAEYSQKDKVPVGPGLMGYYLPRSNRVALFDTGGTGQLGGVIIHESVHQVCYNLGLHRRIGVDPKWVTEGLATTFEPDNFRAPIPSTPARAKINHERFERFLGTLSNRRPAVSLEEIVKSDEAFQTATLDAYAEAWALTFFLLHTRQEQYSRYLKQVSSRSTTENYTPEERLTDFQNAFGKDLERLEVELVRYHLGLN